jgi:hypothetical protein
MPPPPYCCPYPCPYCTLTVADVRQVHLHLSVAGDRAPPDLDPAGRPPPHAAWAEAARSGSLPLPPQPPWALRPALAARPPAILNGSAPSIAARRVLAPLLVFQRAASAGAGDRSSAGRILPGAASPSERLAHKAVGLPSGEQSPPQDARAAAAAGGAAEAAARRRASVKSPASEAAGAAARSASAARGRASRAASVSLGRTGSVFGRTGSVFGRTGSVSFARTVARAHGALLSRATSGQSAISRTGSGQSHARSAHGAQSFERRSSSAGGLSRRSSAHRSARARRAESVAREKAAEAEAAEAAEAAAAAALALEEEAAAAARAAEELARAMRSPELPELAWQEGSNFTERNSDGGDLSWGGLLALVAAAPAPQLLCLRAARPFTQEEALAPVLGAPLYPLRYLARLTRVKVRGSSLPQSERVRLVRGAGRGVSDPYDGGGGEAASPMRRLRSPRARRCPSGNGS